MPFHIADLKSETRTVSKQFTGGQTLTLVYKPHVYTSREQAAFEDSLALVGKACPQCGARLPLEEMSESEKDQREEAIKKRKGKAATNGHVMYERTLVCSQCNAKVETSKQYISLLSGWLADVLVEADWDDEQGPIPVEKAAIESRVLPNVLTFAFGMITEDKSGNA